MAAAAAEEDDNSVPRKIPKKNNMMKKLIQISLFATAAVAALFLAGEAAAEAERVSTHIFYFFLEKKLEKEKHVRRVLFS